LFFKTFLQFMDEFINTRPVGREYYGGYERYPIPNDLVTKVIKYMIPSIAEEMREDEDARDVYDSPLDESFTTMNLNPIPAEQMPRCMMKQFLGHVILQLTMGSGIRSSLPICDFAEPTSRSDRNELHEFFIEKVTLRAVGTFAKHEYMMEGRLFWDGSHVSDDARLRDAIMQQYWKDDTDGRVEFQWVTG